MPRGRIFYNPFRISELVKEVVKATFPLEEPARHFAAKRKILKYMVVTLQAHPAFFNLVRKNIIEPNNKAKKTRRNQKGKSLANTEFAVK